MKYYIIEEGVVTQGTVEISAENHNPPANGVSVNTEQETKIKRWFAAGHRVYWDQDSGFHLDPTRDPPEVAPPTPAPAIPTAPDVPVTPHASEAAFELVLDSLVSLLDTTATKGQKTTRYAAFVSNVNSFKQTLED